MCVRDTGIVVSEHSKHLICNLLSMCRTSPLDPDADHDSSDSYASDHKQCERQQIYLERWDDMG